MVRWRTSQNIVLLRSGTIGKAWDYKHLAPMERKQLPMLHFHFESAICHLSLR